MPINHLPRWVSFAASLPTNALEVLTVLLRGETGLTVTEDQRPLYLASKDEAQSKVRPAQLW